jgi:hypothetical protein
MTRRFNDSDLRAALLRRDVGATCPLDEPGIDLLLGLVGSRAASMLSGIELGILLADLELEAARAVEQFTGRDTSYDL